MKRLIAVLLLITFTSGCATLASNKVAAGCQLADGITTYVALSKGAVEANGLLAGLGAPGILLLKIGLAYLVYKALPEEPKTGMEKFVGGATTALGCIPAINNLSVINSL